MVDDVRDFQKRMLPQGFANETAGFHTQENMEFREAHMKEELEEMAKARSDGDFVSYVDAHIDLIYVAFGSLLDMGVPIEKVWGYVHNANMKKEAGPKEDRPGGTVEWDIYKPEGWTGPEEDIKACLEMHGYEDEQPQLKLQLVQKR
tara:strand:+ start:18068 stop:18508 length:441 start_codon:yes stop_codon:yes gene_type:complete